MLDLDHQQGRTSWTRASWVGVVALVCALLAVTLLGTGVAQALVERLLPTGSQTVVLKVQFLCGQAAAGEVREDRSGNREEALPN